MPQARPKDTRNISEQRTESVAPARLAMCLSDTNAINNLCACAHAENFSNLKIVCLDYSFSTALFRINPFLPLSGRGEA